MASLALGPVSVAVYAALNVASLTALAAGGIKEDVAQGTAFPFVSYEVDEEEERGFGTGGLPLVDLRVHVFSTYEGWKEAQAILGQAIALLKDQALTIVGYQHCGRVFYDRTVSLDEVLLHGIKCRELVAEFRIYAEEA